MKKEKVNAEAISVGLYREHDISEWQEKCLILSKVEQSQVLKDLKEGITSNLVELVKLPFPKFVETYFKQFPGSDFYLSDPTFGYRLYIMKEHYIRYLGEVIKNPNETISNIAERTKISIDKRELNEMLTTPYENLPRIRVNREATTEIERKYLYISQYIDALEAERMGLTGFTYFTQGTYRGFDLEGKLSSLNEAARIIICRYLGLYGYNRTSIREISNAYGIPTSRITTILNYLFDALYQPTESLRSKIGYVPKDYGIDEFREYNRRDYKEQDLAVQVRYILVNKLSESEKTVLETRSNKEQTAYVIAKYIEPMKHKDINEQGTIKF